MEAVVPELVAGAIAHGYAEAADAARLTRRWSAWWKGVPWTDAQMGPANNPCLGEWIGLPWSATYVTQHEARLCGLGHGLSRPEALSVSVVLWEANQLDDLLTLGWSQEAVECFEPLWMSSSGAAILSAWKKGDISPYVSLASQKERSSAWKPKGVSVRLYAPLRAMPARKRVVRASRLAVMKAP